MRCAGCGGGGCDDGSGTDVSGPRWGGGAGGACLTGWRDGGGAT